MVEWKCVLSFAMAECWKKRHCLHNMEYSTDLVRSRSLISIGGNLFTTLTTGSFGQTGQLKLHIYLFTTIRYHSNNYLFYYGLYVA